MPTGVVYVGKRYASDTGSHEIEIVTFFHLIAYFTLDMLSFGRVSGLKTSFASTEKRCQSAPFIHYAAEASILLRAINSLL